MNDRPIDTKEQIRAEIEEVGRLPIVGKVLDLICKTTGMRFAAVTRVTSEKWVALAVVDKLDFGVKPGDEFALFDTLCSEVWQYEKPVIIDDVPKSDKYKDHPIPKEFNFRSHISVPITRGELGFYGTICAIDPEPNDVQNERIMSLLAFCSSLITDHLETVDLLKAKEKDFSKQKKISHTLEGIVLARTADLQRSVRELARSNKELSDFSYIASHDLQEPLRKIQTYLSLVRGNADNTFSNRSLEHFDKVELAVLRMRNLINDLLAYSVVQKVETNPETVDLAQILNDVKETLSEEIAIKSATIEIGTLCDFEGFPFQVRQLLQNLIGNSLKYSSPERYPVVSVGAQIVSGVDDAYNLDPEKDYCKISVTDNGIGFDPQFSKKIFEVFQRLHGKTDFSGTGIGLAIVKKIVENHKGFIAAKSVVGEGSEFTVWIPV